MLKLIFIKNLDFSYKLNTITKLLQLRVIH